ncbi:hypothetical protein Kpol_1024p33 [Vanderwaltozyma polyspora DSM 70294]|uniref:Uncharacterized protein n=1 Tax=Vanderwaltozyma polyspora (strain ATCC 22028 / DSM 70294 / BCRC 21397 / CBS 2163 / NBRC 10782 / NRRL Y-8283 / UCD 57-17) TaxID=436907 RepID=A7TLJ3_VANPO|nr:uncharacterized protein Kpol_1024p33 [Vanderwaltozyma polyspora DSM 70294]EDO16879.1 hypothetical protein Kpol_1024p33 [Vanderwaltozyma polyspora DSM 70294]
MDNSVRNAIEKRRNRLEELKNKRRGSADGDEVGSELEGSKKLRSDNILLDKENTEAKLRGLKNEIPDEEQAKHNDNNDEETIVKTGQVERDDEESLECGGDTSQEELQNAVPEGIMDLNLKLKDDLDFLQGKTDSALQRILRRRVIQESIDDNGNN